MSATAKAASALPPAPLPSNRRDKPAATIFAIFGGAGDLTWRKLIPALFDLSQDRSLPEQFAIVVVDRAPMGDAKLRKRLHDGVSKFSRFGSPKASVWNEFAGHVTYVGGDFKASATYRALGAKCDAFERSWKQKAQRVYYMATPPSLFGEIPKYLAKAGLSKDLEHARLVVEKPIGYDLESALSLNRSLQAAFDESQIFRIDHYLGKETVQNILAFRFANPIFEPIWNRRFIDSVTITVAEAVGVEHRGGYYDHAGALRDMVQNHLMQLLCLVAMEPMVNFNPDEIRNKKVDVLHALRPITPETVREVAMRGQYGPGHIEGKPVPGYREEEGVDPESQTETFAALRLHVDNWRWQDVPFYLRTGKRLPRQVSEIAIQFRAVPHQAFPSDASLAWKPSRLVISIQPYEGIILGFQAKYPGPKLTLRPVDLRFNYKDSFDAPSPDAYETLLWDVMMNDQTLFMRADQVEAAWKLLDPVIQVWKATPPSDFPNYAAGTWGPEGVVSLLLPGDRWASPAELIRGADPRKKKAKRK